ncbi:MAG: PaaI family thioesterase [Polyangiaceae bacterium]
MPGPSQHSDGSGWDAATPANPVRVSPFADLLGFDLVERSDGRAVVECTVVPAHANTRGIAHGGIMSALMDTACGGAVAYQPSSGGRPAVTLSLTVTYLHPAHVGERLRAVGFRCESPAQPDASARTPRTISARVEVTSGSGVLLAVGLATMRLKALAHEIA